MKLTLFAFAAVCLLTSAGIAGPVKPNKNNHLTAAAPADFSGNLEYDFSKAAIRPSYYERLDKLATYLKDNNAALTLRGYADAIGTFKGNWALSEKRAVVVKSYLVEKGVKDENIVTTAFGSTKPITTNRTAAGRQKNRRVEIKVNTIN